MFNMTMGGNEVVVEWEGRELNVWIMTHDEPAMRLKLSEDQIDSIKRAITKVRQEKWSDYQSNKQHNTKTSGS